MLGRATKYNNATFSNISFGRPSEPFLHLYLSYCVVETLKISICALRRSEDCLSKEFNMVIAKDNVVADESDVHIEEDVVGDSNNKVRCLNSL